MKKTRIDRSILKLLFALALVSALVGQSVMLAPPCFGVIGQGGGTIYFEDSFEDETPRKFGLTFGYPPQGPPANWGADTRDWLGSYIELQDSPEAAYDGNIGLYFFNPGLTYEGEPGTNDNMLGVFVPTAEVLYMSWYQKFENFPQKKGQFIFFLMSGGSYESPAGRLYCGGGEILLDHMLDNGNFSSISAPYVLETYTWYHFEVMYKYGATDGAYRVWIDNELIIEKTDMNTTPLDGLEYLPCQFQFGVSSRQLEDYGCWADNVLSADYDVGREEPIDESRTQNIDAHEVIVSMAILAATIIGTLYIWKKTQI